MKRAGCGGRSVPQTGEPLNAKLAPHNALLPFAAAQPFRRNGDHPPVEPLAVIIKLC